MPSRRRLTRYIGNRRKDYRIRSFIYSYIHETASLPPILAYCIYRCFAYLLLLMLVLVAFWVTAFGCRGNGRRGVTQYWPPTLTPPHNIAGGRQTMLF